MLLLCLSVTWRVNDGMQARMQPAEASMDPRTMNVSAKNRKTKTPFVTQSSESFLILDFRCNLVK